MQPEDATREGGREHDAARGHDHHHHHHHHHHPAAPGSSAGGASLRIGRRGWAVVALVIVAGTFLRLFYFVDETQYVYVTQFGEPVRLDVEPGLGFKWPFQSVRRFDRRLQLHDPPPREVLTEDKENLNVDWYVCWRLPSRPEPAGAGGADSEAARAALERHVRQFLLSVGGRVDAANRRLEERLQAALAAELGSIALENLVSLDPEKLQLESVLDSVRSSAGALALEEYGIEIVDVRLKRFDYPDSVRPAVFDEIRSERARVAVRYRAEGESEKIRIQSLAAKHRAQLLARARREATRIRGEGEARAMEIYNEAHGRDPRFYEFLKTLDTYRRMLDERTTIVLSARSRLLRLLRDGLSALGNEPSEATALEGEAAAPGEGPSGAALLPKGAER